MKEINSVTNIYIKELSKLDKNSNYFLLEGLNSINEAINKNIVKDILITKKHIDLFSEKNNLNLIIVNEKIINKLSSVKNSQGIVAVCYKKQFHKSKEKKILILDNISDPGNLGTVIRSAASFNFDKIILSENSVSLYNQKVLRSSQGSFLHLDIEIKNLEKYLLELNNKNYKIISTFLDIENTVQTEQIKKFQDKKLALLFGSEANGINKNYKKYIDENFKLPTNKIESLNLAIACSIIMFLFKDI